MKVFCITELQRWKEQQVKEAYRTHRIIKDNWKLLTIY